jgi:hypothetical protein
MVIWYYILWIYLAIFSSFSITNHREKWRPGKATTNGGMMVDVMMNTVEITHFPDF